MPQSEHSLSPIVSLEPKGLSLPATHLNWVDFSEIEYDMADTIGTNMRSYRHALDISSQQCAKLMKVSPSQYQRYEAGINLPRLYSTVAWSLGTGIPILALFRDSQFQSKLEPVLEPTWQPVISFVNLAKIEELYCLAAVIRASSEAKCPQFDAVNAGQLPMMPDCLTYYRKIGQNLKLMRNSMSLSQAEAAEYFGVSETTYRRNGCPEKASSLSLSMMMRFYLITGLDPLVLSVNEPLFAYRLRQRRALEKLTPFIHSLAPKEARKIQDAAKYFLSVFKLI